MWWHLSKRIAKHAVTIIVKCRENVTTREGNWIWTQLHSKLPHFVTFLMKFDLLQVGLSKLIDFFSLPIYIYIPFCCRHHYFLGTKLGLTQNNMVGWVTTSTGIVLFGLIPSLMLTRLTENLRTWQFLTVMVMCTVFPGEFYSSGKKMFTYACFWNG